MLSESLVASLLTTSAPPSTAQSALRDVGICTYEFQPNPSIRSTLKKSSTNTNCVCVSQSHIFAAQSGKAVVFVYSRERGNQEATIPFPERIRCLAIAGGEDGAGAILVMGTDGGRLIIWETCTGRQVSTPAAHLGPITALVVDPTNNFVLSGSEDGNIHVWSLPGLISFSSPDSAGQNVNPSGSPIRTISNHSAAITSIAVGHSSNRNNIAVSIAKDQTAIVWEYRTGKILRIYLLPANPLCLALDPADRAFCIGYDDGSIQLVDFFKNPSLQHVLHDPSQQQTPQQLPSNDRWLPPSNEVGAVECLTLSYDATSLLSGHLGGSVICWDITKGRFSSTITTFSYPVTNIQMLRPEGLPGIERRAVAHNIVKPRYDPESATTRLSEDAAPATYSFSAHLNSSLPPQESASGLDEFVTALYHPYFSSSLIAEGLAELHSLRTEKSSVPRTQTQVDSEQSQADEASHIASLKNEIESLTRQVSQRESARNADLAEITKLREYVTKLEDLNNDLVEKGNLAVYLERGRRARKELRAMRRREAWFEAERSGRNGDRVVEGMEIEDDDGTSESDEMSSDG